MLRILPIFFSFFVMGFVDAMGPLAGTVQKQYQLSGFVAGLLPAFAFVAFAIFSVPGGVLAARIGKRNLLLTALALNVVGVAVPSFIPPAYALLLGCIFVLGVAVPSFIPPAYALLLGCIFILGVGTTLLQVSGNPIVRDVSAPGAYSRNLSFAQFIKGVGSAGATALVGYLASGAGGGDWRRLFPIFLVLTVACLLAVLLLKVKEAKADVPPSVGSSLALLGEPVFALAVLGIFLYVGAEVGLATWLGPLLERMGLDSASSRYYGPTLFFAMLTIGRLLGSAILLRLTPRSFFQISAVLGGLGILGLLSGSLAGALCGVVACGLGFANIWPLLFSLTVEVRPDRSSELSGLMCMAIFGGAVLPPLMGRIADAGMPGFIFVVPLISFVYLMGLSFRSTTVKTGREA